MTQTEEEWQARKTNESDPDSWEYEVASLTHCIARDLNKTNAHLIATAFNSCIKLNPGNPQAVAEGIPTLYESLEYIIRELDKAGIIKANSIFMLMPNKALAKVKEK